MADLTVRFKGLMGFVPRYIDGKNGITALFPTVDNARLSNSVQRDVLLRHYQFLRINSDFIASNSPRSADLFIERGGVKEGIFFTTGEELAISTGAQPTDFVQFEEPTAKDLHKPDINAPVDVNNRQARDIKWLAKMEYAYPGAGAVDLDCLTLNEKGLISGRLSITEGTMEVSKLSQQKVTGEGKILAPLFLFPKVPPVAEFEQAVSEEVVVKVGGANVVLISSEKLSTGIPKDLIILQPKDGMIEFIVHNSELEEFAGPIDPHIGAPIDFELLYDLCSLNIPLNARRTPSVEDGGAGDRICPGGMFSLPATEAAERDKSLRGGK